MARRESKENSLRILDNISGGELEIYYRMPTTREMQSYMDRRIERRGNQVVDNGAQVRLEFGKKILTGVRHGDFERLDEKGKYRPLSHDESAADYYPEWKNWMVEHAADVLTMLAVRVFENSAVIMPHNQDPATDNIEKE